MTEEEKVQVEVRAVLPTNAGSAVFIGNDEKVFVIYVERGVGDAITMFMRGTKKPRPLTHDLMGMLIQSFGAEIERVVINDLRDGVYYARLIIAAENELHSRKVVELDGRPSDCVAMAVQASAPIFVNRQVWAEVDDMSAILKNMDEEEFDLSEGDENEPEDFGKFGKSGDDDDDDL